MAKPTINPDIELDKLARDYSETLQAITAKKESSRLEIAELEQELEERGRSIHSRLGSLRTPTQTIQTANGYRIHREQTESVQFPLSGKEQAAVRALRRLGLRSCLKREVKWSVRKNAVKEARPKIARLRSIRITSGTSLSVTPPVKG